MERVRILVVGAYGETGEAVVGYLATHDDVQVVAFGRRLEKLAELQRRFASTIEVVCGDIANTDALRQAVRSCAVVVNCVGPMKLVADSVAAVAVEEARHYVDPGGTHVLHGKITRRGDPARMSTSAVISSGWISGVSEVWPLHLLALARREMDAVQHFNSIHGDNSLWSPTATSDVINFVREADNPLERIGRMRQGRWSKENFLTMWHSFDLPHPVGRQRAFSRHSQEFASHADKLGLDTVGSNVALISLRTLMTLRRFRSQRTIDLPQAVATLNDMRRRDQRKHAISTFIGARIEGTRRGKPAALAGVIVTDEHYRATGTAAGITALLAARRQTKVGVHFVATAVEATRYMSAFTSSGFRPTIKGYGALADLDLAAAAD